MPATLRDLINILFRSKRTLLTFWAVALLAVLVFYTQTERKYESKARILVSIGSENQGRADYLVNKNMQLLQREQQIHDEQQILLSDHVMLTTAKWILGEPTPDEPAPAMGPELLEARQALTGEAPEPTLLLKAVKVVVTAGSNVAKAMHPSRAAQIPPSTELATKISKSIESKTILDSDVLDVSFRYRNARVAQTVLKLVLAAYIEHHIAVFQNNGESDLLKSELNSSVDQYQKQLAEMAHFMTTNRVFAEDAQIDSLIRQRQEISQAIGDAAAEEQASAARISTFAALNDSVKRYETYSTSESRNRAHDELVSRLNDAQLDDQALLNLHPEGSRTHEEHAKILARVRELLAAQPTQLADQKEERRSAASELIEQQLITAKAGQKSSAARLQQLKHELESLNGAIDGYARNLPGYNMIKLNLSLSRQQSEQMGQAYLNSRLRILTAKNEITDISVVDTPSWEPDPATPKKGMVALLTMALLILGGAAIVLIKLGLDQTVSDGRAAEAALNVPVAAVLPLLPSEHGDVRSLLGPMTDNEFARVYMQVRDIQTPGAVILVAGSRRGEGLSLVGYELARFLEKRSSAKTALLDLTAGAFEPARGQSGPAVLSLPDDMTLPYAEQPLAETKPPTAALLSSWRKEFSYLVVACDVGKDIHRIVDVLPEVSATYVVVAAGETRKAAAKRTIDLLRGYGTRSIELILNKRTFFIPTWLVNRI